jgi:hypothetical protein
MSVAIVVREDQQHLIFAEQTCIVPLECQAIFVRLPSGVAPETLAECHEKMNAHRRRNGITANVIFLASDEPVEAYSEREMNDHGWYRHNAACEAPASEGAVNEAVLSAGPVAELCRPFAPPLWWKLRAAGLVIVLYHLAVFLWSRFGLHIAFPL